MSILLLHTILLESMDWDEDAVDEAISRAIELYNEMSSNNKSVTVYEMKKELNQEYSQQVSQNIVNFFDACQHFKKQLDENEEEEMVPWEDFIKRRNVNFQEFKIKNNINSPGDLLSFCKRMGVTMPGESQLLSLFPSHTSLEEDTTSLDSGEQTVENSSIDTSVEAVNVQHKKRKQKSKGE